MVDYFYWCFTFLILLVFLMLISKSPYIDPQAVWIGWNIALFRALILYRLPSPISIYNWINPPLNLQEASVVRVRYHEGYNITDPIGFPTKSTISVISILMICGLIVCFLYTIAIMIYSLSVIKNCQVCENNDIKGWINSLSINNKYRIKVLTSNRIKTPISCNLGIAAYMIVPESLGFSQEVIGVYEHEYTHIKHGDTLWKYLSHIVLFLHWYNPLIWVFFWIFNYQMEIACDNAVLKKHGNSYRAEYARLLLELTPCKNTTYSRSFTAFSASLFIKERIRLIMMYKSHSKKVTVISLIVILSITLCLATNSFACFNTRVPITPDPFEVIMSDKEFKNVTFSGFPEPKSVTLSLTSGTVGEHDIRPNERFIYKNNSGYWKLKRNQEISIRLDIVDRHYQTGQMTVIGFLCEDYRTEIFAQQISTGAEIIFFAPRDGNYLFYIDGRSSGTIMVNSLTIQ